jgi:hypothetical protein
MRTAVVPLIATAILATACTHDVDDPPPAPAPVQGALPDGPGEPLGFEIRRDQPQLLPFWVRHQRLAALLDVPTTDPVFDVLVANRLLLGDNDHASGVAPDLAWTPAKMALWARALLPVCAHPNLLARHPFLNIDLPRAAWGRDPSALEAEGMRADLDAVGLAGAARTEAACIAVLSSLEMVTQ